MILNLFEEHLDHYGTKEAYFAAKRNIYAHQRPEDLYFCNILEKDDLPRPLLPDGDGGAGGAVGSRALD